MTKTIDDKFEDTQKEKKDNSFVVFFFPTRIKTDEGKKINKQIGRT